MTSRQLAANCMCCGMDLDANGSKVRLRDRRKGLAGEWCCLSCKACGVYSMVPVPSEPELSQLYERYTDEGPIRVSTGAGSRYPRLRRLFHRFTGDVDPRDFVTVPQGGRVLDYGSGQATYLSTYHADGVDIWGAEVTEKLVDASTAAGLKVRKVEDFNSIPFEDGFFDVVYLMQVFEHLRDPHRFMRELARIVRPGGQLYLAVPNVASFWRRLFGENWVSGWFAPFHLAHYNATALGRLGQQHGFTLRRSWSRTPDSWFRLNLRAWLHTRDNMLDRHGSTLDLLPVRFVLVMLVRFAELFVRERDCLVVHLERR